MNLQTIKTASPSLSEFRRDVLAGLSGSPKAIPCKWLYDREGARLFDLICEQPEYYPTRTETALLRDRAADIAALAGPNAVLVEFGSGAGTKTRIVLDGLDDPAAYVPIDVSIDYLRNGAAGIARDYPRVAVIPVHADYMALGSLPERIPAGPRIGFFPGSTIGNLVPEDAVEFLRIAARLLGRGGALLLGVDLKKPARLLNQAYNDRAGVTARFTLNLLTRVNRELAADFDPDGFCHDARYSPTQGRVEIYLRSLRDQKVHIAGHPFWFAADERMHVEYSYKYTLQEIAALAEAGGFTTRQQWTDDEGRFSVNWLQMA
jgi:dimethylhistidine N-methyltransferase